MGRPVVIGGVVRTTGIFLVKLCEPICFFRSGVNLSVCIRASTSILWLHTLSGSFFLFFSATNQQNTVYKNMNLEDYFEMLFMCNLLKLTHHCRWKWRQCSKRTDLLKRLQFIFEEWISNLFIPLWWVPEIPSNFGVPFCKFWRLNPRVNTNELFTEAVIFHESSNFTEN